MADETERSALPETGGSEDRRGVTRRATLRSLPVLAVPYLQTERPVDPAGLRQSAEGVSFIQAGIGARLRTAESKAREIVSVLDFGARGDGETDDTVAFDAAIATGKRVFVPYSAAGYVVSGIRVVSNMEIVGEKSGMAPASLLIVGRTGAAAFHSRTGDDVFHCTFENLSCKAGAGVTGASFYSQSTTTRYSGYFTFRNIETFRNLKASYRGLFIFTLWDRCRDGYLGGSQDGEHSGILALAGAYGQTNQQNVNRIRDSMFFGAFGGAAAIVASYGVLWLIENTDFEDLKTRAFAAYNVFQIRFSSCWFENIRAPSIVHLGNYPGSIAASTARIDHCNFVLTGGTRHIATVDDPGTIAFRSNFFNQVGAGVRLCDSGARVTVNEDNLAASGIGASGFFAGMHHDDYSGGRRKLNGAVDNRVAEMNLQNAGGVAATEGFMSRADLHVGPSFVTVATSRTGLGGTCIMSGYDPDGGLQVRLIKDWQGSVVRDMVPPLNRTGKALTFRVIGNDLQMKVDAGALVVFTTMLH